MAKQDFMSISCYQFMFLLGIIDMITVPCNAIIYGIQGMLGVHYCQYPRFFYIVGSGWFGSTATCCLLALDRFFGFLFPNIGKTIFSKNLMKVWLVLPPIYYLYTWFNANPMIFNPDYMAVFMIRFMGQKIFKEILRHY
uniref:Uncharacterized protein n=1 Tax=Acrobeloides nanus TaxID=290746 RepID=A0A914E281_9BILA